MIEKIKKRWLFFRLVHGFYSHIKLDGWDFYKI